MARRIRHPSNPNLQWFEPPLTHRGEPAPDTSRIELDGAMTGLSPELWGAELAALLDRLWSSDVGRIVVSSVRRRTTFYVSGGGTQTYPDPNEDIAGRLLLNSVMEQTEQNAATPGVGANAQIIIDLDQRTQRVDGAIRWDCLARVLHELVHAVNITCGNYQIRRELRGAEAVRSGTSNREEEMAIVIDNMYRSETGRWLRRGHASDAGMLPPGTSDMGTELRAGEERVVSRCERVMPAFARRLAALDRRRCPYNPFRERARRSPVQRAW